MMSSMHMQNCTITSAEDTMWPPMSIDGSMDSASSVFSDTSAQGKECKENGNEEEVKKDPGRWTADEHILFLRGMSLHGKSWKKISEIVKTRSVVQIRTHAQKYLIKLEKARKAGHQGVLMMDGKGVDNTERRGTTKKSSLPAGTLKPASISSSSSPESSVSKTKKQVQRPAGHVLEQQQQDQHQQQQQILQQHQQQLLQQLQQRQQQQQPLFQFHDTSAPALMPIPSSFPLLNLPAGAMNWAVAPYPTLPISSAVYNMQQLMAPQGLDIGGPLLSPSSHARASFIAALARGAGAGQRGQDLTTLPLASGLQAEMTTQLNQLPSTSGFDESSYKHQRLPAGVAAPAGAASSTMPATSTGATAIPLDQPTYRPSAFVVPQQPCVLPAAISSYARPMMAGASSSSSTTSSFSPSAPGQYNKVPDPLEELMQSLTRGKLSSSSSSSASSSIGPEVDELPSMHDMHVWELTDKHARPSSLRSWDEEDFDNMSSSSSSDHASCSPASVSEFQFPSAA